MKRAEKILNEIVNRPENLFGVSVSEIKEEMRRRKVSKKDMQSAKCSLNVISVYIPPSADGEREEDWLWMRC